MLLPISLTFAAAAALLNLWLALRVGRVRRSQRVLHGDGGNAMLTRRMRAQANYVEYTPFVLILMLVVELAQGPRDWLWVSALAYIVARVLHAFGMDRDTPHWARMAGIGVTFLVLLALTVAALLTAYGALSHPDLPPSLGAHA